jgi:hypothetical protein
VHCARGGRNEKRSHAQASFQALRLGDWSFTSLGVSGSYKTLLEILDPIARKTQTRLCVQVFKVLSQENPEIHTQKWISRNFLFNDIYFLNLGAL